VVVTAELAKDLVAQRAALEAARASLQEDYQRVSAAVASKDRKDLADLVGHLVKKPTSLPSPVPATFQVRLAEAAWVTSGRHVG
jgi:hypothetical protein